MKEVVEELECHDIVEEVVVVGLIVVVWIVEAVEIVVVGVDIDIAVVDTIVHSIVGIEHNQIVVELELAVVVVVEMHMDWRYQSVAVVVVLLGMFHPLLEDNNNLHSKPLVELLSLVE